MVNAMFTFVATAQRASSPIGTFRRAELSCLSLLAPQQSLC